MLKTKPIRFNRIIAMLLSLIMLCGILPFGALPLDVFADDVIDYEISICGRRITSNNDYFESAENNPYGVAFDKVSNTLYLSAASGTQSVRDVNFISYFGKGTLTVVVLAEDIRIDCIGASGFLHATQGSVVFSAESKGRLSICNGLTTAIKANELTVEGGEICMELTESGVYANTAIEANFISVKGGGLEVYGGRSESQEISKFENTGIVYNTGMTVSGGVVVVDNYAYGIVAKDDKAVFNIKGGTVDVDAFRTGVKDGKLCHTAGALHAAGNERGIYAAGIQVSGIAELLAVHGTYSGDNYPVYAKGLFEVDTDVLFISAPKGGCVDDHPYGGKIIFNPATNQPAHGVVNIMPRVSCFVRRNDGPEEEYPLPYCPANSGKFDLFQVPVGDKIVIRLVANDGQLLYYSTPNGPRTAAQKDFLKTKRSEDQKELTITFEPTYLPEAAWTNNAHSYNKDESKAGSIVYLGGNVNQFSCLIFEALLGTIDWEVYPPVTIIPRGETLRVRVPLKTDGGRDIAVSKEEFEAAYALVRYTSSIGNDGYDITHDGDSSVIVEMKVSDNARLGNKAAQWDIIFSNSYGIHRFSLEATVVECWCDMGERLIERPVSEAACTVGGCAVKHWECSKCGKLFADAAGTNPITDPKTVLTPAKGHSFTETVDAGYLKSAADCENPAVYYKSCEYCGLSSKELYDLRAAAANFVPGSAETVTIDGVEFYILAVDDGKALLLTKETVAAGIAFDSDSPKWSESDIRAWLNGEWLAGKTRLAALAEPADIYTAAAYNDQENTVASRDKVFLLSEADVTGEHDRKAVTNNALYTYNGAKLTAPGEGWGIDGRHWWLRSPCSAGIYVSAVTDRGMAHSYPHDLTVHYVQPRPAMWVRFDDPDPTPEWQYKIGKIVPGSADTVTIDGVEFHVLAKDAAKGEALLLTKNVLDDNRAFGGPGAEWVFSDLRTWLNGEWLEGMPVLKNFVNETNIMTRGVLDDYRTQDKVFLLSAADVFGGGIEYTYNEAELPAPGGSWVAHKQDGTEAYWWLRSLHINNSGSNTDVVDHNANPLPLSSVMRSGVRPAVWVPYKEPEWQYQIGKIKPGSADTVTIDGVEFHVLAKDAAKGEALLLTKNVLDDNRAFGGPGAEWVFSDLRTWLNGEWLEGMPVLKNFVNETKITTSDSTTLDKVFLLTKGDVFGGGGIEYTYNKAKLPAPGGSWIAYDQGGLESGWWLRSVDINNSDNTWGVNYNANPLPLPNVMRSGVRPAMWVPYKEPEWQEKIESITPGDADTVTIDGVEFHVLAKDEAKGEALLLTKHVLFNKTDLMFGATPRWADSMLREFMNGIMPETSGGSRFFFPYHAPTLAQYAQETEIYTSAGYDSTELVMTRDRMFLLSEADLFGTQNDHPEAGSNVFTYNGAPLPAPGGSWIATDLNGTPRYWWLRSPRLNKYSVAQVLDSGNLNSINSDVEDYTGIRGVRPALWIQYKEPVPEPETFENGSALGHDWGTASYDWSYTSDAVPKGCTASHTCKRCGHTETEDAKVTSLQTEDPTCTAPGVITYTATFTKPGFNKSLYKIRLVAKLEHSWGETVDAKYLKTAADCTNAAVYHKSCGSCGDKHTSETFIHGNPLGHKWVEKAEDEYLKSAATCTNAAVYHKSCGSCGDKHTSETFESGNALGHDYGKWYVVTPATDRRKGLDRRDCKRVGCDHFETSETNMVEYKTELEERGNGKTTVEPADPQSGDGVKITVEPGEDSRVKEITVTDKEGNVIDVTDKGDGEYEFTMPEGDVKIVVEYEPKPAVTVDENEGGKTKVEPEHPDAGDEVKITVTPEEDKRVKEITVTDKDGNKIDVTDKGNGEYEFTMPDGDVTIEVEYEPKPTVTVDENEGGKTVIGPKHPDTGDRVDFTVTPEEDKRVKEITVTDKDGNKIDVTDKGNGEYEFTMPDGDVTIEVEYEPKPTVTVDENEGGKTVIGPKHPDTGDRVDFTVTPEEDKRVKEITVTDKDGNKIDVTDKGNGEYEFTMPDSDVSIKVVYEPKPSPEIPPTGDNSKLSLWLMLMCISGIGVIATSLKRKKRKYNS